MFALTRENVEASYTRTGLRDTRLPKMLAGQIRVEDDEMTVGAWL
jgi:hypothetical protein